MNKSAKAGIAALVLLSVPSLSPVAHAGSYSATRLTHIAMNSDGTTFVKWDGSPGSPGSSTPNPCGENFGWVKILPASNEAMKALALSIYFSGDMARIDTSGCDGTYEIVVSLYTPSG
jgi:hypothetical protein